MTMGGARKAVRQAVIAAFLVSGLNLSMLLWPAFVPEELAGYDPQFIFIFNLVLYVGCGVGLLRCSRMAAVILFLYFGAGAICTLIERGPSIGAVAAIVFSYFFWKGIQGSFTYHRLRREADRNYRPSRILVYLLGISIALLVIIVVGISVFRQFGVIPSTAVIDGDELLQRDSGLLIREGIVRADERIQLFYSTGLISIRNDGNLMTDKRIISYERIEGKLAVYATPIENVAGIKIVQDGDDLNDTIVEISTVDGERFCLFLSTESNGDERFINEMKRRTGQTPWTVL